MDGKVLVFDVGSSAIRVGFNHQVAPKLTIPSFVGRPKTRASIGSTVKDTYVGVDLPKHRAVCDVSSPFGADRINTEDLMALFRQCFELINADPEETHVVITDRPDAVKSYHSDLGNIFLNRLQVPSMMMVTQGVAGLFGCGATSGIVLDSSDQCSRAFAVVDGIGLPNSFVQSSVAGNTVTQHLAASLVDSKQTAALQHVPQIKEALCFLRSLVEDDDPVDLANLCSIDYALPDGQVVTLGGARFEAPEVLFTSAAHRPSVPFAKAPRISDLVREAILAADTTIRDALVSSTVVCGGAAMTRNFSSRLEFALERCYELPPTARASFALVESPVAPCDRNWVGAAILSSLSSSRDLFVSQKHVATEGMSIFQSRRLLDLR